MAEKQRKTTNKKWYQSDWAQSLGVASVITTGVMAVVAFLNNTVHLNLQKNVPSLPLLKILRSKRHQRQ
jgi:hypothetical protein